jgi:hypothetical protein
MLAANNVSANRVVTKVQFDTKATAPKLLFSAVAAVETDDLPTIVAQGKTTEAENAVKLSVYQPKPGSEMEEDDGEEFSPAPAGVPPEAEPVARETAKPPIAEEAVSDVVKKWSKKKG